MVRIFLVLASLLAVAGCKNDQKQPDKQDQQAARYTLAPAVGGVDTDMTVHIESSHARFAFGATDLDLGKHIKVKSVTVHDGYSASADIHIEAQAELGARDAHVFINESENTLTDAFTVIAESIAVDPDNGKMGELLDVAVVSRNFDFQQDQTWASFGDDVEVLAFDVLSPSLARAQISIYPNARPGLHDVAVERGASVVTLYDGFTVDRASVVAVFDPPRAKQGETVAFELYGLGTNFTNNTDLEFWDDGGWNQDIVVREMTVIDSETVIGRIRLSNAAAVGYRDIRVRSGEDVLIPEGFEVLDAPPDLDNVAVGLAFDVRRGIDNSNGQLLEQVRASAIFVIPLDPPCGPAGVPPQGPMPYDLSGVFPAPPEPDPVDCPIPETVNAGKYVWFESPVNTVTLHREVISATGQIVYFGRDLTLDDYVFDQVYDLHTQGHPKGLPEYIVERVQPTVPSDYYHLTPDLWGDYTHDRSQPFSFTWTPARTYPKAIFSASINGSLIDPAGASGFASALPWDDGSYTFTAGELLRLQDGPSTYALNSYIEGRYFGLPGNNIQSNQSDSALSTVATVVLE